MWNIDSDLKDATQSIQLQLFYYDNHYDSHCWCGEMDIKFTRWNQIPTLGNP